MDKASDRQPLLSVVTPSYDDAYGLELTLRSLTRQTIAADHFEVVVVRDGPGEGYESIQQYEAVLNLRVAVLPQRRGRSAARNAGLALANGRVILFLDSDCYAHPELLDRHRAFHGSAGPRVLLGVRYEIDWPQLSLLLRDEPIPAGLLASPVYRDPRFLGVGEDAIAECLTTPWLFAHTNNASVPADVVAAAGGFNEEFGTRWGWEDLELFYRVHQQLGGDAGLFVHDGDAVCYHLPRYRDVMVDYMEFFENESVVKRAHPHLDWEFHSLRLPTTVAAKVRHYRKVIDQCVRSGACRVGPHLGWIEWLLAGYRARKVLWIGMGTAGMAIDDGALTFDYHAPPSTTNLHLIGTTIPAADGAFDAVVSIDFWRCLQWEDLCAFMREGTRVASAVVLARTADAVLPLATAAELDYLVRAFGPHFEITVDASDAGVDAITVRRSVAQPAGS